MADCVIQAEGLGKRYRIGTPPVPAGRGRLRRLLAAPFRYLGEVLREPTPAETLWALRDVSFEVERGEVLGVIGRNGAGKSTLLKILSRITEPTEGEAEIRGRMGSLLEVGSGFHPALTGRENIYLNGAILGMRKVEIDRKFDEIVAFAEVERFIDTRVRRYSSGMYVRLAFAVAAHLETEILLVDEVLAVGDSAFQKKCLGKMDDVAKGGRTVLFVSHSMGTIASLCSRVVYLADGRVKRTGPAQETVSAYLSEAHSQAADGVDLAGFRHPHMGKEVRFSALELLSGEAGNVPFDEPLRFRLEVESGRDLAHLSIGAGVYANTGACVGTLFTDEEFAVQAGRKVVLHLDVSGVSLAPGFYHAGFSIGRGGYDGSRDDMEIVVGTPAFQVLPVSEGHGSLAGWRPNWGHVVLKDSVLRVEKG